MNSLMLGDLVKRFPKFSLALNAWDQFTQEFTDCIFQQQLSLVMLLEMHHISLKERKGFVALS